MKCLSTINDSPLPVAQGNYAEAEPLYRRSLAISEKALGPDHPEITSALNNLARALKHQVHTSFVGSITRKCVKGLYSRPCRTRS